MKRATLHHPGQEKDLFQRRAFISIVLIFILCGLLILRLNYLQVEEHQRYTTLSEKNQQTVLPLDPTRGLIYDRNGTLIATNVPVFSLEVIPPRVKNLKDTLRRLQTIIPLSPEELDAFYKQLHQRHRYDAIPLKIKLTPDEVAEFYVNQYQFPGVVVQAQLIRNYPYGDALVDVLGFVGRINENDLKHVNMANYGATNYIGKLGIEKYYENELHGTTGYEWVETDAGGRTVRVLQNEPAVPGKNLYLTIDAGLQLAAKRALGNERGSIVVIDTRTGGLLAMVSNPTYDPNLFVNGMPSNIYKELRESPDQPLFNRSIRGQYPLASTIKPFLALGALNAEVVTPQFRITDPGFVQMYNHTYRDWQKHGHGVVDISKAIIISCDTFFYLLSMKLGVDRADEILHSFGYGEPTGIDLGEELPGLVPSPAWKRKRWGQPWYLGDTIVFGIGQGYMLTTPLQMAAATMGLANRGIRYQPHLVAKEINADGKEIITQPNKLPPIEASEKNWDLVLNAMQRVITEGTARRFGIPQGYTVAGKTGTGQVYSTRGVEQNKKNLPKNLQDNSMFIAFAPVENPEVAIAVVMEHSPGTAKLVARDVLDYWFLRGKTAS